MKSRRPRAVDAAGRPGVPVAFAVVGADVLLTPGIVVSSSMAARKGCDLKRLLRDTASGRALLAGSAGRSLKREEAVDLLDSLRPIDEAP